MTNEKQIQIMYRLEVIRELLVQIGNTKMWSGERARLVGEREALFAQISQIKARGEWVQRDDKFRGY
jgi:hypothetical protein